MLARIDRHWGGCDRIQMYWEPTMEIISRLEGSGYRPCETIERGGRAKHPEIVLIVDTQHKAILLSLSSEKL